MKPDNLEQIFHKYREMLYRIAFTHTKNHAEAEDVVQEVFVKMLRKEPAFSTEEHEKAWLIRVAINLCKDLNKSAYNQRKVSFDAVPESEKTYFSIPLIQNDEVLWAVMELPDKYKNPVYLFYYEDYSIKEIARILGEQENTVKTHLRRGREALKSKFA